MLPFNRTFKSLDKSNNMSVIKSKLAQVPTPAAGLALGIASIGKLLSFYGIEQYLTPIIASILITLVFVKFVCLPKHLWHFSPESMKLLGKNNGFEHQKSFDLLLYYCLSWSSAYLHFGCCFSQLHTFLILSISKHISPVSL